MARVEILKVGAIEIEVHYKKMKNIYLKIKPDGKIVISAPLKTSKLYLKSFVIGKMDWIEDKLDVMKARQNSEISLYASGYLFGEKSSTVIPQAELNNLLDVRIRDFHLKYWSFFDVRGCKMPLIKYREMKTTWGVCRPLSGTITYNKRLIYQPLDFIEYVVVHELCHLIEANHSRNFWDLVATLMPDYKTRAQSFIRFSSE